jgi:hypothetical protein
LPPRGTQSMCSVGFPSGVTKVAFKQTRLTADEHASFQNVSAPPCMRSLSGICRNCLPHLIKQTLAFQQVIKRFLQKGAVFLGHTGLVELGLLA